MFQNRCLALNERALAVICWLAVAFIPVFTALGAIPGLEYVPTHKGAWLVCVAVLLANYHGIRPEPAKALRWYSQNTLGVYYSHVVLIHLFGAWLMSVSFLYNLPGNLLCAALLMTLCTLFTIAVKKVHILKYLVS